MKKSTTANRISRLTSDFRWVHVGLGLIGNAAFFIGSFLFLFKGVYQEVGVWLFIVGSFGMLLGSVGEAVVKYERHELNM